MCTINFAFKLKYFGESPVKTNYPTLVVLHIQRTTSPLQLNMLSRPYEDA